MPWLEEGAAILLGVASVDGRTLRVFLPRRNAKLVSLTKLEDIEKVLLKFLKSLNKKFIKRALNLNNFM